MSSLIKFETKISFGKDAIKNLPKLLLENNANKVLIVYGGGSIRKNNIFGQVVQALDEINLPFGEFGGIEPNPRHTTVDKAIKTAKSGEYDFILAVGGGSVIDAAKIISAGATNDWDTCWSFIKGEAELDNAVLPVGVVLTLAATASENNAGSVISNEVEKEKYSGYTQSPVFVIENPEFTYTVNNWQTASGSFDIFSHVLEQYFGAQEFDYTDNLGFGLLKTLVKNVPIALQEPTNYEARANLMITSSFALNSVIHFRSSELGSDWTTHQMEHSLSAVWDVTHGAGLALITPYYLAYGAQKLEFFKNRLGKLGKEVYGVQGVEATIEAIKQMIKKWGLPAKYSDFKEITSIDDEKIDYLVQHAKVRLRKAALNPTPEMIREIYKSIPF